MEQKNMTVSPAALMAFILIIQLSLSWVINTAEAQDTRVGFYSSTCPNVESIVRSTVESHVSSDQTAAPALLRLFFHDCFVQGCDGSILITGPSAEKNALTNLGLRGFDVIEDAKTKVEAACPGVVSCADILVLATRDAVVLSKGTSWNVPTGRRDGLVSSSSDAADLPTPSDSIDILKKKFSDKGLNTQELVTLVGAHTIGQTDCQFFNYRLYNFTSDGNADPTINSAFVSELQSACPFGGDASKRVALDKGSQTTFDTSFFKNVRDGNGVLESDQRMWADNSTSPYVSQYAQTSNRFGTTFGQAMIKMGNIGVKTGSDGEIRSVCSAFN